MVDFTPDAIAHRSFRTTLRGFDQSEVVAFLSELAEAAAALTAERDRLAATLQTGDAVDLKREIETVSSEVHSVLEAARSAAETMRERAAAETARWRSEAIADAEKSRREAQADAEHLRTDAWTTSEALLSQAQREAEQIKTEAEKESLRLVGEAEREAHRTLGAGRREAEETIRSARMEAEKLVLDARASHDEIIETATRKAEVAQERTRALEERRDELRRELDSVRSAIAAVESELDERREALGATASAPETPPAHAGANWVPGETVRVVRPGHTDARTDELPVVDEPRSRPEPTPELRVLTPEELRRRQQGSDSTPQAPPPEGSDAEDFEEFFSIAVEAEDLPDEVEADTPVEETAPDPAPVVEDRPVPPPVVEDVDGLFARLRDPARAEQRAARADEAPLPAPAPVPATVSPGLEVDPFEIRDRLLLPIANRALRNLKRQLTEEQNGALERIRIDHEGWEPDSESLEVNLRPDLIVLVAESFAAGHAAAESLTSSKLSRPVTPTDPIASEFVASLTTDITRVLADGRAHDHGSRQVAADISRVFRAWRTDESERRIRHFAFAAFNRGLVASLPDGMAGLRWVVAGRGCAKCRDLGGRETVEDIPPAHEGCGCTLVPT
ncbi:MAG: DivIVA domain-containing protein [Acidimicrobiia bacterium]